MALKQKAYLYLEWNICTTTTTKLSHQFRAHFLFRPNRKWLMFWQQATFFDQPFSTKGHSSYHHYHPLCIGSCFTGGYMSVPACICLYLLLPPLYMCNHDNLQYMLMMLLPRPFYTKTNTMVLKFKKVWKNFIKLALEFWWTTVKEIQKGDTAIFQAEEWGAS